MKKIAIKLIRSYQYFSRNIIGYNSLPLFIQPQCRYYPTCSDYAIESISKHGFFKGSAKGIGRILSCNPIFHINY